MEERGRNCFSFLLAPLRVLSTDGDEEHVEERSFENVEDSVRLLGVNLHAAIVLRNGLVSGVHESLVQIQHELAQQHTTNHTHRRREGQNEPLRAIQVAAFVCSCNPSLESVCTLLTVYFFFFFFFTTC